MKLQFVFVLLGAVFSTVILSGCKKDHGTVPVTIRVLYKGEPVKSPTVCIYSADGSGRGASAVGNENGVVKVMTGEGWNGAFPGEYAATIVREATESRDTGQAIGGEKILIFDTKNFLPAKYASVETSGLTLTVEPKRGADVTFDLQD